MPHMKSYTSLISLNKPNLVSSSQVGMMKPELSILIYGVLLGFHIVQATHVSKNQTISQVDLANQTKSPESFNLPIQLELNKDIYTPRHLDLLRTFLYTPYELRRNFTLAEVLYLTQLTRFYTSTYDEELLHRYSNQGPLKSDSIQEDQELCLSHLEHLVVRANQQNKEKYDGKDFNFHQLLDTYGRAPSGVFLGSTKWPGEYEECKKLSIEVPGGQLVKTRYCIASLKPTRWQESSERFIKHISLGIGVCLPEMCNSDNYKNKYALIKEIAQFNAREVDKDQAILSDLYCLPQAMFTSHISQRSTSLIVMLVLISLWILLLLYSTFSFRNLKQNENKSVADTNIDERENSKIFRLQSSFEIKEGNGAAKPRFKYKLIKSLSITNNFSSLFKVREKEQLDESGETAPNIIDLRIVDGFKVICMSYVICSHVLMVLNQVMENPREMANLGFSNIPFAMANMMPAFSVNSFFAITGILTTYFLFKNKQSQSLSRDGRKWLALIVYRYLRIMPMYIVVAAYSKYLAKFTGEGPFWDYATSPLTSRGYCEEESWMWTLLIGSNFKHPLDHCVPSAWYLANDFQFLIVTPIFIGALNRSSNFGKQLLRFGIIGGFSASFLSILAVDAHDFGSISRFEPHGFRTYTTFFHRSYTRPQYRIPAYLWGMLVGFALYEYEKRKIEYFERKRKDNIKEPDWTSREKKFFSVSIWLGAINLVLLPIISSHLKFNEALTRLNLALFSSLFHLLFAVVVGLYILLAATGAGSRSINKLLSASFWKPLSKLSLCAVLVNLEVVNYVILTTTKPIYLSAKSLIGLNITCILFSYLLSVVCYIIFEAPLRELINLLLNSNKNKNKPKQKSSQNSNNKLIN